MGCRPRGDVVVKRFAVVTALIVLVVGSGAGNAQEPSSAALAELRQRILRGTTGTVEGRVYLERMRPDAPDEPLVGVGVLLVPRSPDLLERLETVKRQSRESVRGFREAAPTVRAAVDEYESDLWQAGYPDAAIHTSTDGRGVFRAEVPAGAWLLVVQRGVFVPLQSTRSGTPPTATSLDPLARYSTSAYQHFLPVARLTGFDAVSVWLREVDVEPAQRVVLELHDRGVWLSGVIEETEVPRRVRFTGGSRKR